MVGANTRRLRRGPAADLHGQGPLHLRAALRAAPPTTRERDGSHPRSPAGPDGCRPRHRRRLRAAIGAVPDRRFERGRRVDSLVPMAARSDNLPRRFARIYTAAVTDVLDEMGLMRQTLPAAIQ